MPKVFIIILNFNGWPDTLECLESLNKVNYDNFEVILIDNGSKEPMPSLSVIPAKAGIQDSGSRVKPGMTEESGEFSNLKITQIFNKENLGFAGGNNQGIKLALDPPAGGGADYVLLLNNDTTVEPDFLTKLVQAGEASKKAGILGPVIYDYADRDKIQFAGGKINRSKTRGTHITIPPFEKGGRGGILSTDYITGCCFLIKRETIEKIGLLSEDYFLYYEDTDWCLRAQKAGWFCGVVPTAKIYHKASKSSVEFSYPYIYYHSRNGLIFASRFGSKTFTYFFSVWFFIKQLVKVIIGYKRDWAKAVMAAIIDFWKGKKGKLEGYY